MLQRQLRLQDEKDKVHGVEKLATRAATIAHATGGNEVVGAQKGVDYKQAMGASVAAIGAITGMTMTVQASAVQKAAEKLPEVHRDAQMEAIIDDYLLRETEMLIDQSVKSKPIIDVVVFDCVKNIVV